MVSAECGSAGPEQSTDRPDVVVGPREDIHAVSRHAAAEEGSPERPDTALAARLVAQEIPPEAGRQDWQHLEEDHWQAVPTVRHQSSPLWPFPTAFAIIPPMLREDMYCSVKRKACSSVMPLSLRVL